MNCPQCNQENPGGAALCCSCGWVLSWELGDVGARKTRLVKAFRLAIVSLVLGILSVVTVGITTIPAVICGIISLVKIEKSGGRVTGKGYAVIGIAIPGILCSCIGISCLVARVKYMHYRSACQNNLHSMGLLFMFYDNWPARDLPRAGGKDGAWGTTANWQGDDRSVAFGLDSEGKGGQASISSSLYRLIKTEYSFWTPALFVCPADSGTTEFVPAEYGVHDKELVDLWDFGPDPSKHVSYSYHIPYGPFGLGSSSAPGMAIVADRNPWIEAPGLRARDFSLFDPGGTRRQQKAGNAVVHQERGQNVLFVDGHVSFERSSACGVEGDNIYTSWNTTDISKGVPPSFMSQPASGLDSLLVHDPPGSVGR